MKREMTIAPTRHIETAAQVKRITVNLAAMMRMPIAALSKYYSAVLEQDISIRQTLLLLNAQAAFIFAAFPVEGPVVLRVLCVVWLLHALLKCKQEI